MDALPEPVLVSAYAGTVDAIATSVVRASVQIAVRDRFIVFLLAGVCSSLMGPFRVLSPAWPSAATVSRHDITAIMLEGGPCAYYVRELLLWGPYLLSA
jgi:hypothetical protein